MSEFGKLRRYLMLPRRPARIERDVSDELRSHLTLRAEELERRGASFDEARAQALREFGDLDDTARYCAAVERQTERRRRARDWFVDLVYDARHALRLLRRSPAFTAATVLTLGLALGASSAVYSVLHAYLIRPLPFPASDRLVWIDPPSARPSPVRGPSLATVRWSTVDSLFARTMTWDLDGFTFTGEPYAETVTGAWISPGYVPTLGVRTAIGRSFRPDEYRERAPVAIISHGLWQRRFGGDSSIVGAAVTMHSVDNPDAPSRVTVVGVLPKEFWPIHWRESELVRPFTPDNWMPLLAQLNPGTSRSQTERQLDAVVRRQLGTPVDAGWRMRLVPALEQHSRGVRPLLLALFGAALFMLLAASASVAGALVSRTAARRREVAIRLALGGGRLRLVRQLLTESAVLAMLSSGLGLAFALTFLATSAAAIERLLGTTIPGGVAALRLDLPVVGILAAASALVGVALGVLPAFALLRRRDGPVELPTGRGAVDRGTGIGVRRVLIAGQVVVAMVLLFGAGLMFRSIARINALELGFRPDGVMKASVLLPFVTYPDSAAKRLLVARLRARLLETDGVRAAAAVFPYPFRGGAGRFPVLREGAAPDEDTAPRAGVHTVTPGYFGTMNIAVRAGRDFRPTDDHAAPLAVVISERLAMLIAADGNVLGRRIRIRVPYLANFNDADARPWRTIVGVVADTRDDFSVDEPPDVYIPYAQNPRSAMGIVVRARGAEREIIEPVRRAVTTIDPSLALSGVAPLGDAIAAEGGQRHGLTLLLSAFAIFSLGLSALALYASLSYMVAERRGELAVRMAIGASARSIVGLVLGEGMLTTAIGLVLGAVASLALGRVLGSQLYAVAATDPATLVEISVLLLVTVVLACVIPTARAARIDPSLALRE